MEFEIKKGTKPYGGRKLIDASWYNNEKTLALGYVHIGGGNYVARGPRLYKASELIELKNNDA